MNPDNPSFRKHDNQASKYWICDECAKKYSWTAPEHAVSVIKGSCGHCENGTEQLLTPTVDFKKPNLNNNQQGE